MKPPPIKALLTSTVLFCAAAALASVDSVDWLAENQRFDLVLSPETIPQLTDHEFETYTEQWKERLIIQDIRDGLWRVDPDLTFYQAVPPEENLAELEGDQHTLSFDKTFNVLIERLDLYAHEVEEALKFSACANVVVRDCRMIAGRQSEDAVDIVRGQNYIFIDSWFLGLGTREMTAKGSVRYLDIIKSQFGMRSESEFRKVFRADTLMIGDRWYEADDKLLPREVVPDWIRSCLLFSSDRSLGLELGAWSDYDIGFINSEDELETRPPTRDVFVDAIFILRMSDECDRQNDLVPVLRWHTAERVEANAWVFEPTETSVFGELVEELYYEVSEPSAEREAELRNVLGSELDYEDVELPRYALGHDTYGNNRFFGALYNWDDQFVYSPHVGWLFIYRAGPLHHDAMKPGTWLYHYPSKSFYLFLGGKVLPEAWWWNATEGKYYRGFFQPWDGA